MAPCFSVTFRTATTGGGGFDTPQNSITASAPDNTDLWTASGNYASAFNNEDEAGIDGSTEEKAYEIRTAEQLALLAYRINSYTNSTYRDLYYVQTANIDLSAHYWDAIGTYTSRSNYSEFAGHYDGGGYEISGLYTQAGSTDNYSYQGLFGYVRGQSATNKAVIENVGIIDSNIQGYQEVGGVVGQADSSTITNCYNTGSVSGDSSAVGGVVGCASSSTITNCYNTGSVSGSSTAGGVVGYAYESDIANCYNTGSVSGSSPAGGVVGDANNTTIENCYNTGPVTGSDWYTGGVVGHATASSTITNCYNTGAVTGDRYGGGVVGRAGSSTITNNYYGGNCTLSYGIGSSSSNSGASKDSNLIANAKSLIWYQDSSKWNYVWDFEEVWSLVPSVNDGYPILRSFFLQVTYDSNLGDGNTVTTEVPNGESITIEGYDLFARTGYEISHWNTSPTGSGVNYYAGGVYAGGASLTLYAQWEPAVYKITLDWNGGENNQSALTEIYVKYGEGVYSNASATTPLTSLSTSNLPRRQGFYLVGYYTANSTMSTCLITATDMGGGVVNGNFTDVFTTTYFTNDATLYAQWDTRNPAYYDEEGGYWYVENGRLPQTRVSGTLKTTLQTSWSTLEKGSTYSLGGVGYIDDVETKVYNGEEYYRFGANYYIVEPIRWRLTSSQSQAVGYGTTDDVYAIMDTIVYFGRFTASEYGLGADLGYNDVNNFPPTAIDMIKSNHIDTTYLVTETKSMLTFGTGASLYGDPQIVTDNIFVSSREEIMSVAGTYEIEFSDLIYDFITNVRGSIPLYYTRDLGTNYNHIICLTEDGEVVQRQPNQIYNQLGVQFTIKVSEYACVG